MARRAARVWPPFLVAGVVILFTNWADRLKPTCACSKSMQNSWKPASLDAVARVTI